MIDTIRGDVLTPEMKRRAPMVKGDRGGFNFETPERETILAHLVHAGFIDDWQEDYVWTFMELRHAWLLKSNFKTNSIYKRGVEFFATPDRASEFYDLVCHRMGDTVQIVLLTIDPNRDMSIMEIEVYRIAIDKLTSAMDFIKKQLADAEEKA